VKKLLNVRVLLVISIILCLGTGLVIQKTYRKKFEAQIWVNHTYDVIQKIFGLANILSSAETNQRGYLITGDSAFLTAYQGSGAMLLSQCTELTTLVSDNRSQIETIQRDIRSLVRKRVNLLDSGIYIRRTVGAQAAQVFIANNGGKTIMDTLQARFGLMIDREKKLLAVRTENLKTIGSLAEWVSYTALLIIALVSVAASVVIKKGHVENRNLFDSLEKLNENLEQRVEDQTAELRLKNEKLIENSEKLESAYQGLLESDEDVRANLEQISDLQSHLEKSERKYRLLSENSMDVITVFNNENQFEYVSPSCREVLGYEPEELIGKNGSDLVHPDDIGRLQTPVDLASKGMTTLSPHFRLRHKDGSYIWIETHSSPMVNESGTIVGLQASNRDITARKEMEFALQSEKTKAEEATRAKSAFLSMMSHEIRTPMNAIIGLTNILLEENPTPAQVENLKLLKFSGGNLLTIINDILDFSKIEANKMELEIIDVDIHQMMTNIIAMLGLRARDKGISLSLLFDPQTPRVIKVDQVRLSQVITNLLGNALKFTEKGGVSLSVACEEIDRGTNKAKLAFKVKDSGIGIEKAKIQSIFDSFTQAASDTTRRFGGTGLGLAITKRLLNLMGSDIYAESTIGHGTTFSFVLTANLGELVAEKKPENGKMELNKDVKVLLVDDNRVNQLVAGNFLKKWKVEFQTADDGNDALQKIQSKAFDIVLMDLQMPGMDGYEATKAIRAMPDGYFKTVPIIALTASAMTEIRDQAIAAGMTDFISKPFQPDELNAAIVKYSSGATRGNGILSQFHPGMYAAGDPDFKRELASLVLKNVRELKESLKRTMHEADSKYFAAAVHKIQASIKMLGDLEYRDLAEEISKRLTADPAGAEIGDKIFQFIELSDKISQGLEEELREI